MDNLNFISGNLQKLRKSEIKVAEYVLQHPNEVVHYSISELADLVGVSDPTVIRFCRGIGFKGFQNFKIFLAQSVIPMVRTIHEAVDGNEDVPDLVKKVFESNANAILSTLSTLDHPVLERMIETFSQADKLLFFGLGGSAVIAMDAYHKFFRVGIHCEYFTDSHMAIMAASMMKPSQVFVAISHSGATRDVVKALEVAKQAGAVTVAIVSHEKTPVARAADAVLTVASSESHYRFEPMSSMNAQMSVIDVLAVGVSLNRQEDTIENLNKTRVALASERY